VPSRRPDVAFAERADVFTAGISFPVAKSEERIRFPPMMRTGLS
jgi:hypothetical protein